MCKRTKLRSIYTYILVIFCFTSSYSNAQQKVGLVLSGGGAAAIAHVGVIKALEEYGIPIDYISGTSAGALVGALYANGYSPEEIEAYVLSDEFLRMAKGENLPEQHFLLRKEEEHSGMISFSFAKDSLLRKSLPTNFISSSYLDFELFKQAGSIENYVNCDFDELFVPYRCVASDIAKSQSVVYSEGDLNAAVRASMTFPFYLKPIEIDGVLLFDGGLYNNFPTDVMYQDFGPDYIIGSNVSYNAPPPDPDGLIGQLTNMLVRHTNYELPCQEGYIIEPNTEIGTFDFDKVKQAIQDGYDNTVKQLDSILPYVTRKVSKEELTAKRSAYRQQLKRANISSVRLESDKRKVRFIERALQKKKKEEIIPFDQLEKRYYRLYEAQQIDFMFPTLEPKSDSTYELVMKFRRAKDFKVDIGGHISSRPVNTGYFGLTYQTIGRTMTTTRLESYFGKFYGSAQASFKLDLPNTYPFSTTAYFTLNRWDYFRSFATFFEDVKPSFLVQNEIYAGAKFDFPVGNNVVTSVEGRGFQLDDRYYQTDNFTNQDTADVTSFDGGTVSWSITQNSLNRKQFASSGHYVRLRFRYVNGREQSVSGSTAIEDYTFIKFHSWINLGLDYQSFIVDEPAFHLGLHGQLVFNSQSLFANFTASQLAMTEFSLVPDAKTYFLPEYRSPQFIGVGLNTVFTIKQKLDVRLDTYLYQPFVRIEVDDQGNQSYSKPFKGDAIMASASVIYNSFIGPVRFTTNLFPKQENPFSFQFSLGYILFNERAIR